MNNQLVSNGKCNNLYSNCTGSIYKKETKYWWVSWSTFQGTKYRTLSKGLGLILEEAKFNILQAQQKQKERYDKKHANPHSYSIGTKVLLKDF